jgi:NarL family two-component system response regulator YdfI
MSARIRVVVVDDHAVIRKGLQAMLEEGGEEFLLVGEAADGAEALKIIADVQPDVVLMDVRMPGMGGIEAIAQIRQRWSQIAVLILTTYNEDELVIRGLQSGAAGYLLKDTPLPILLEAIRTVARGERFVQVELLERVLPHAARGVSGPRGVERQKQTTLTPRELDILAGVARGERSKEIAARLGITERTVKGYLATLYLKLGVDSRASAVAVAMEQGLLSQPEKVWMKRTREPRGTPAGQHECAQKDP